MGKSLSTTKRIRFPTDNLVACFSVPEGEELQERINKEHICLEKVTILERNVSGVVAVEVLSENADMKVRYTMDSWTTFHEISGVLVESKNQQEKGNVLKMGFEINDVPAGTTLEFAICCQNTNNGSEFWDNNKGKNYKITDVVSS